MEAPRELEFKGIGVSPGIVDGPGPAAEGG